MKAVIAVIIIFAAAVACAAPGDAPTPRPTYTPYPTYTPAATATPRPTYTPYPNSAVASGDFTVAEVDGSTGWIFGAAADAYARGQEQFSNGEYEAAIASFKEAKRRLGKPSDVLESRIGVSYDALERYDIAIVHHSNAIAISDDAVNRVNRAISYFNNSQCDLAIIDAKGALGKEHTSGEGYSTDAEANFVLAWCYSVQGKYLQALQHADAGIAIANDYQYAEYYIAIMTGLRDGIRSELNR